VFWITTLLVPVFFGAIIGISAYSSASTEERAENLSEEITDVRVIDQFGIIDPQIIEDPFSLAENSSEEELVSQVENQEIDGLIVYPDNLLEEGEIKVYAQDNASIFGQSAISSQARSLLQVSAQLQVEDPAVNQILVSEFDVDATLYTDDGQTDQFQPSDLVVPGVSLILYFFIVFSSAQYLLQSVAEEKENRMIETILSMIDSNTLISGKIISLTLVALTQVAVWLLLIGGLLLVFNDNSNFNIPVDLSTVTYEAVPLNIFFTLSGLLLLAATMVGVGATSTSYKDSQGLSSVFTLTAILPVYFITILIDQPNGLIAQITSYFPFTSGMIFVIRNSLGALSPVEMVIGVVVNVVYVLIAFYVAAKLFDLGALMYRTKPKFKDVMRILLNR
jgi:ABC-2 type transport system permease protein